MLALPVTAALALTLALAPALALTVAVLLARASVLSRSPTASVSAPPSAERWSVQKDGAPISNGKPPTPSASLPEKNHVESPGSARAAPGAQPRAADKRSAPAEHVPHPVAPLYE